MTTQLLRYLQSVLCQICLSLFHPTSTSSFILFHLLVLPPDRGLASPYGGGTGSTQLNLPCRHPALPHTKPYWESRLAPSVIAAAPLVSVLTFFAGGAAAPFSTKALVLAGLALRLLPAGHRVAPRGAAAVALATSDLFNAVAAAFFARHVRGPFRHRERFRALPNQ